ncbi:MAG TPA: HD domain-containing phosphohydrolase [Anaerolineaceae bacterium]|jgi:PAS domain S-box-containing protein
MPDALNVLVLEDRESDAELMIYELRRAGFAPNWRRVENEPDFLEALDPQLDVILADYSLPQFDALKALHHVQSRGLEIPLLIITGSVSEEVAVECMKQGAADYLLKDRLARLGPAVHHALEQTQLNRRKKEAEQALLNSEALNHAIQHSQNSIVAILDSEGTILMVNEAWEQFVRENGGGGLLAAGKGSNYLEVARQAAESGDEDAQKALVGIQSVLSRTEPLFSHEYPAHSKSRKRWFLIYVTPMDETGGGVVVTHLEITQRKLAEERLTLLNKALEAADNTVIITDRAGTIVWVNPAFTRLTGYTSSQAVGHYSHLANSRAHDPIAFKNMWKTILDGQVWHSEILNRHRNGSTYMAEITITPVYDENDEITHFIDIEQDITERKQHERELEAIVTVANALRTAKIRSEMLPVVIHQIVDLVKADTAAISLYDPQNDEMVFSLAEGVLGKLSGSRFSASEGLTGFLVSSRTTYITRNALEEPRLKTGLFNEATALAGVPLLTQGQLVGILWIGRKDEFSSNEERLLNAIADISASAIYRASLYEETEQRLQRLTALREVDKAITASLDVRITLSVLVEQVIAQLSMHAADVLLLNSETQSLEYVASHGFRYNLAPSMRILGQSFAHQAVLERRVITIPDINQEKAEFANRLRVRGEEFVAYFAVPLIAKGQVKGVLELFHRAPHFPNSDWLNFLETLAGQAAIAIDNAELFNSLQRSNINLAVAYDDTIEGWARALDLRDHETEFHSRRVTEMTMEMARAAGIRETELVHVRRGALLHDIGKMAIPDAILLKPGPLTQEEWEIIRMHPKYAFDLLSPIEYLRPAIDIPYCHHEWWDGSGYPRGLKANQIPLAARVFSIIDVFDALEADRPYRTGWGKTRTLDYICEQSGKQFDPELVEQFLNRYGEIPAKEVETV